MPTDPSTPSKLEKFLSKNTISEISGSLPAVHSTKSHNLESLIEQSGLKPSFCKNFDENLLYFFLGRPAFRTPENSSEPQDWELPTCFIFDDISQIPIKRVFPFDSGAFKSGRYPTYIGELPDKEFIATAADSPSKIVSAFFGDFPSYVQGTAKSRDALESEHSLGPLDAEILAVQKLASDGTPANFDDRRFSIEIQVAESVDFAKNPPDAVILPTVYLKDSRVRRTLEDWKCEVINYDTYSLNISLYYGIVFDKFATYCKSKGFL